MSAPYVGSTTSFGGFETPEQKRQREEQGRLGAAGLYGAIPMGETADQRMSRLRVAGARGVANTALDMALSPQGQSQLAMQSMMGGGGGHGGGGGGGFMNPYASQARIGNKGGVMAPPSPNALQANGRSGMGSLDDFYAARTMDPNTGLALNPSSYSQLQNRAGLQRSGNFEKLGATDAYYQGRQTNNPYLTMYAGGQLQDINSRQKPQQQAVNLGQGINQAAQATKNIFGKFLPMMAKGGPAKPLNPYLVGEEGVEVYKPEQGPPELIGVNGPEIRMFPQKGQIIPNDKIAKLKPRVKGGGAEPSVDFFGHTPEEDAYITATAKRRLGYLNPMNWFSSQPNANPTAPSQPSPYDEFGLVRQKGLLPTIGANAAAFAGGAYDFMHNYMANPLRHAMLGTENAPASNMADYMARKFGIMSPAPSEIPVASNVPSIPKMDTLRGLGAKFATNPYMIAFGTRSQMPAPAANAAEQQTAGISESLIPGRVRGDDDVLRQTQLPPQLTPEEILAILNQGQAAGARMAMANPLWTNPLTGRTQTVTPSIPLSNPLDTTQRFETPYGKASVTYGGPKQESKIDGIPTKEWFQRKANYFNEENKFAKPEKADKSAKKSQSTER